MATPARVTATACVNGTSTGRVDVHRSQLSCTYGFICRRASRRLLTATSAVFAVFFSTFRRIIRNCQDIIFARPRRNDVNRNYLLTAVVVQRLLDIVVSKSFAQKKRC
eukprot:scaffold204138_cov20-Prasinocladus_malaysianus.AAC.1